MVDSIIWLNQRPLIRLDHILFKPFLLNHTWTTCVHQHLDILIADTVLPHTSSHLHLIAVVTESETGFIGLYVAADVWNTMDGRQV